MNTLVLEDKKICSACDSETTYTDKRGYEIWYWHDDYRMCKSCYHYYVSNPVYNPRKIRFKNKRPLLPDNPRTGKCNICHKSIGDKYLDYYNKIKILYRMTMHHMKYNEHNVLKDTLESCDSCHMKITMLEKKLKRKLSLGDIMKLFSKP